MTVKVAIAQINSTVGDFAGNASKILAAARHASEQGADVLLTPELSLAGYPPEDLLLRESFYGKCNEAFEALARSLESFAGLHVVIGLPLLEEGRRSNAAVVLAAGKTLAIYRKAELPNYTVFDEKRYFHPSHDACVFTVKGTRFGLNVCEDTWFEAAPSRAREAGAEVLLVLNGSPFHLDKQEERHERMRCNVTAQGMSLVYANLVGGQDELVFDGNSFVMDRQGRICVSLRHCEEELRVVEFDGASPVSAALESTPVLEEQVYRALVLGVRDYVTKNGFPGAIIGLSGGVDSALTLAVAVDALGAEKVRAVMMPSPYTADISWIDSRDMVARLGVRYDEIRIDGCFDAFRTALAPQFEGLAEDTTEENLQARIRGTLLMALSNKTGSIVLTTGNKSEMAVGYCTLYGDMAGGFAVIKDVLKTLVYRLCEWRNQQSEVIPDRIITRPPSAELRPGQLDQDSLPPYEVLDGIVRAYMEEDQSLEAILAAGFARPDVERIIRLIKINEYKRRQAPVGIRITARAFGRDWRYPITSKFRD